jgi:hypothetical protein
VSTVTRQAYSYRTDPTVPNFPDDRPIIIFDGYCALCCGWAQFVLRHDRRERFRFLPAQSPLGQALYVHYGLDTRAYETNILIADGLAWFKSESTIRMAEALGCRGSSRPVSESCRSPCAIRSTNTSRATGSASSAAARPVTFPNDGLQTAFWDECLVLE